MGPNLSRFLFKNPGQPISRILCGVSTWMGISLDRPLPDGSSGLPGAFLLQKVSLLTRGRRAASRAEALCPCLTLLRAGVTWPRALLPAPVVA